MKLGSHIQSFRNWQTSRILSIWNIDIKKVTNIIYENKYNICTCFFVCQTTDNTQEEDKISRHAHIVFHMTVATLDFPLLFEHSYEVYIFNFVKHYLLFYILKFLVFSICSQTIWTVPSMLVLVARACLFRGDWAGKVENFLKLWVPPTFPPLCQHKLTVKAQADCLRGKLTAQFSPLQHSTFPISSERKPWRKLKTVSFFLPSIREKQALSVHIWGNLLVQRPRSIIITRKLNLY